MQTNTLLAITTATQISKSSEIERVSARFSRVGIKDIQG